MPCDSAPAARPALRLVLASRGAECPFYTAHCGGMRAAAPKAQPLVHHWSHPHPFSPLPFAGHGECLEVYFREATSRSLDATGVRTASASSSAASLASYMTGSPSDSARVRTTGPLPAGLGFDGMPALHSW